MLREPKEDIVLAAPASNSDFSSGLPHCQILIAEPLSTPPRFRSAPVGAFYESAVRSAREHFEAISLEELDHRELSARPPKAVKTGQRTQLGRRG